MKPLRVLALEPFFGGSHQQFLELWQQHSQHHWTLLTLPDVKWKWRMRHSAITFAKRLALRLDAGDRWDILFATDMLGLAEFIGLAPRCVASWPRVVYFHENQLTYPTRAESERDHHFGYTNLTTALAADEVWFNSRFHQDDFLRALQRFLQRMPDHRELDTVERIRRKSRVQSPGVDRVAVELHGGALPATKEHDAKSARAQRQTPLRIVWNARWEHDKNPELFFEALYHLAHAQVDYRVDVLGQSFDEVPAVFAKARKRLDRYIDRWGFLKSPSEYYAVLQQADVYVSTADHEFFGIGAVEAMSAGARPLLPPKLSYPELLETLQDRATQYFYDNTLDSLTQNLMKLASSKGRGSVWDGPPDEVREAMTRYSAERRAREMDAALFTVWEREARR